MPNVLPVPNSHTPATNCASPPTKNAMPVAMFGAVTPRTCALISERSSVVDAKEMRPRGDGLANGGRAAVSCQPGRGARRKSRAREKGKVGE